MKKHICSEPATLLGLVIFKSRTCHVSRTCNLFLLKEGFWVGIERVKSLFVM